MRALAVNMGARPAVLAPLVEHPDSDVRLAVAAHIGNRMKIEEIALNSEKQNVFDAIVECYEGRFAPFLVPVCRDADQIQQMFDHTTMTPGNARLFIDNPYSPNGVLLDSKLRHYPADARWCRSTGGREDVVRNPIESSRG
ncbi:hypothetical protein [Aeromonas veronii]|uniref:hypothetical protein n=1 Tax=Aeromonas veronii TaxID=654 RepID=UPI000EB1E9EE|nr:hypothetical protein [Aeromonas veronii]AYK20531.1 hypothetical protein C0073_022810 [Aeromonas veronii]